MDDLLLEAVIRELRPRLACSVSAARPAGTGLLLVLDCAPPVRLLIHPGPPFPRLHPTLERFRPPRGGRGAWPALAALADAAWAGRVLVGVEKPPGDRTVTLIFDDGGRLVVECHPPGRVVLVDPAGVVRSLAGRPADRCRPGGVYARAPSRPGAEAGLSPAAARLLERAGDPAATLAALRRALDRPPVAFVVAGVPVDPSPAALAGSDLAAWPAVLAAAAGIGGEPVPSASLAADRLGALASRAAGFDERRRALVNALATERRRVARAAAALEREGRAAEDPGVWRRRGEALLAAPPGIAAEGGVFRVPDPYRPDGDAIEAPAEPGERIADAAGRCFDRARRGERATRFRATRAGDLARRGSELAALARGAEDADGERTLDGLEGEARRLGVLVGVLAGDGRGRRVKGRLSARVFRSSDGLEILVGRGARDNDHLTFRIAGPEDFWLHARDVSGAHVVVRNPGGLSELPPKTRREAAALAAHYSKASGAAQVDVDLTRRRFVRRARGAPPGTVVVKRAVVVRASAAHPFPSLASAR